MIDKQDLLRMGFSEISDDGNTLTNLRLHDSIELQVSDGRVECYAIKEVPRVSIYITGFSDIKTFAAWYCLTVGYDALYDLRKEAMK